MGQLRKGLAQMLISDLSMDGSFQIVERARLQELIDELKLNQTKQIDKISASKIGKLLGARYMVLGGYFDLMSTLRIDALAHRGPAFAHQRLRIDEAEIPEQMVVVERQRAHDIAVVREYDYPDPIAGPPIDERSQGPLDGLDAVEEPVAPTAAEV